MNNLFLTEGLLNDLMNYKFASNLLNVIMGGTQNQQGKLPEFAQCAAVSSLGYYLNYTSTILHGDKQFLELIQNNVINLLLELLADEEEEIVLSALDSINNLMKGWGKKISTQYSSLLVIPVLSLTENELDTLKYRAISVLPSLYIDLKGQILETKDINLFLTSIIKGFDNQFSLDPELNFFEEKRIALSITLSKFVNQLLLNKNEIIGKFENNKTQFQQIIIGLLQLIINSILNIENHEINEIRLHLITSFFLILNIIKDDKEIWSNNSITVIFNKFYNYFKELSKSVAIEDLDNINEKIDLNEEQSFEFGKKLENESQLAELFLALKCLQILENHQIGKLHLITKNLEKRSENDDQIQSILRIFQFENNLLVNEENEKERETIKNIGQFEDYIETILSSNTSGDKFSLYFWKILSFIKNCKDEIVDFKKEEEFFNYLISLLKDEIEIENVTKENKITAILILQHLYPKKSPLLYFESFETVINTELLKLQEIEEERPELLQLNIDFVQKSIPNFNLYNFSLNGIMTNLLNFQKNIVPPNEIIDKVLTLLNIDNEKEEKVVQFPEDCQGVFTLIINSKKHLDKNLKKKILMNSLSKFNNLKEEREIDTSFTKLIHQLLIDVEIDQDLFAHLKNLLEVIKLAWIEDLDEGKVISFLCLSIIELLRFDLKNGELKMSVLQVLKDILDNDDILVKNNLLFGFIRLSSFYSVNNFFLPEATKIVLGKKNEGFSKQQ
ncbi:hypothetical protein M0812_01572 [Anaeramoeba flamelloides]|uniref:MMS19 nucleotide excision repair protein n=1 Tax=Anaeramoeba flamelloides TaxID=1746091 RepID=A0AAV7Z1G7_9EUKA|nr:hypothetical protein M0812_01572 [Anaeramoeba flamelloides]